MSHNFFLFPHMELRLMFHKLWTNSSCHGYHSLEFPVSWVIKFPTLILLYWFISVTPYFHGLLSLREQSRTFHRLLVSSQTFAFCPAVLGKMEGVFSQGVSSSRKYTGVRPSTPEAVRALGSAMDTLASKASATGDPAASLGSPLQHFYSFSIRVFLPAMLSPCCVSPPPLVLSAGDTENNFICSPLQDPDAGNSRQVDRLLWLGFTERISGGIWWGLRVFLSRPTITKGLHLSDGIWGPLQHC